MTPETVLEAVDAVMSRPFEWGGCDCVLAAAAVFERLHAVNPLAGAGDWRGPSGAARMLRRGGGLARLAEAQAQAVGLRGGHATGGLAVSADGRSLLVCIQPGMWAGKTKSGFAVVRQAGQGWHA